MSTFKARGWFDRVFEGGLLLKGLSGVLEFTGGLLLFIFSGQQIHHFLIFITHWELQESPNSKIAHLILHSADSLTNGSRAFLIIYLWIHAAIKLIAVIGILKNQLWAYPFSLVTLGILMLYQVYSIIFIKVSIGMIGLTIFDIFILWMIYKEYGMVKNRILESEKAKD